MQAAHVPASSSCQSPGKMPSVDDFVGELLTRIQPAQASEKRRKTVAQYVQDVIARAFQPAFEVRSGSSGILRAQVFAYETAAKDSELKPNRCFLEE